MPNKPVTIGSVVYLNHDPSSRFTVVDQSQGTLYLAYWSDAKGEFMTFKVKTGAVTAVEEDPAKISK